MSNVVGNAALGQPKFNRFDPRGDWTRHAACAGQPAELFFLDEQTGSYREARQICATCPVRADCLRWALDTRTDHAAGVDHTHDDQAGHFGGGLEQILYLVLLVVFIIVLLRLAGVVVVR